LLEALVAGKAYTSFGYLAAEGDLMHYFSKTNPEK
jgi:hypothetical protein